MTETIGVFYTQVDVAPGFHPWHVGLYYTNSQGITTLLQALPQNGSATLPLSTVLAELAKESFATSNQNDGSPFGLIVKGPTSFAANEPVPPSDPILVSNDSLQDIWNGLVADASLKFGEGFEYRPLQQNSNTFVATLLSDAGLPLPTGQAIGLGYAPALQYRLHDAIGPKMDLATSLGATAFAFSNPNADTTSVVVGGSVDVTVQWGNGTLQESISGGSIPISTSAAADSLNIISAADGHVVLIGSSGNNTFDADGSDDLMLGGPGIDTFVLGYGGNDWVDGGSGSNTATYSKSSDSYTVTLAATN